MVLGFTTFNEKRRPPNDRINFIKALDGPDKAIAQDYLERVAAMMVPIMREHNIVVMSLDEFPPNREFWGRNFNNGECIQLVLKDVRTGQWLPFSHVLGTMVHELAHNTHMNHSRAFHALRIRYLKQLEGLRAKGYTGEGFWSTGRNLLSGEFTRERPLAQEDIPQHLCGGTYREPVRKERKKLTYKERQQRRHEKKFGTSEGKRIGGDDGERVKLEGSTKKPPPKIAKSNRSRELRAAAALARLEANKKEQVKKEEEELSDYLSTTEDEEDAVDVDGRKMVPVSGLEDSKEDVKLLDDELFELTGCAIVSHNGKATKEESWKPPEKKRKIKDDPDVVVIDDEPAEKRKRPVNPAPKKEMKLRSEPKIKPEPSSNGLKKGIAGGRTLGPSTAAKPSSAGRKLGSTTSQTSQPSILTSVSLSCPVCTTSNPPSQLCCMVCGCVIKPELVKDTWKCLTLACRGGKYINAADYGVCGACGAKRPT